MTPNIFGRRLLLSFVYLFLLINIVACFHAYKFPHYDPSAEKSTNTKELTLSQKIGLALFGVNLPRPTNKSEPGTAFQRIRIQSNKTIEGWYIKRAGAKGTVVLFHGYGGEKSSMLDKEAVFRSLGYSTLLVDFMGSGGSEGNQTTIGYKEALQVKSCYDFLKQNGEDKVVLFGTSLGAAAVMKAASEHKMALSAIILECPFGTMLQTTKARFSSLGIPAFPMAYLLLFWGGVQNGFNAFGHNPIEYAAHIQTPTLLFYGAKDAKVSKAETEGIFHALSSEKKLVTFPEAGHENYLRRYEKEWTDHVRHFLSSQTGLKTDSMKEVTGKKAIENAGLDQ
jgi:pimeloyl-ACP methyl ester carboxylesterase